MIDWSVARSFGDVEDLDGTGVGGRRTTGAVMRKILKILHTLSACGLIGGLGCYMILLLAAPQETPEAYADLRKAIAAISNYVLVPSLAIALISGLISMMVHRPFLDKGWAWVKAALGILMFKGVLTIVGAKADHAAVVSQRIAEGETLDNALGTAIAHEWATLFVVLALSIANVVLGVWRPRIVRRPQIQVEHAPSAMGQASSIRQSSP